MKITKRQLRRFIREALVVELFEPAEKPEEKVRSVDPLVIEEIQELTDLVEKFFRSHRFDQSTRIRKDLEFAHDQWTEDLWRVLSDRKRRVEKGYFGEPPSGQQASMTRTLLDSISNVMRNLKDLAGAMAAGALAAPAVAAAAAEAGLREGDVEDAEGATVGEVGQEIIEYEKTAMDYLDEILSRLRSPTFKDVYLTDIERLVQQIRTVFKMQTSDVVSAMAGSRLAD